MFIPSALPGREGTANITLGAKGAVEVQLIVGGGTSDRFPKADVHSSNHARIESPTWQLVPDMTKDEAVSKQKVHLAKRSFDDVKMVISSGYGPNQTDENSPRIIAQKLVLERAGIPLALIPRNAGSWPGVQFGIGHSGSAHAPDEWFLIDSSDPRVAGLDGATMMYVDFLYEIAHMGKAATPAR